MISLRNIAIYAYTLPSPNRSSSRLFPSGQKLIPSGKDRRYGSLTDFVGHSGKLASRATTCPSPNTVWRRIAPAGIIGTSSNFSQSQSARKLVYFWETVISIYCFQVGASRISRLDSHLGSNSRSFSEIALFASNIAVKYF